MKGKLKWIAALVVSACAAMGTCFAAESDYDALFAKARKYEEQGRYMYALGTYWDAMKADPKKAKDAYYALYDLGNTIADGNPGRGSFDEFTIYDGWLALCKDFEQYWTENCPNSFTFTIRKGELDMATRTATYYVHITVNTSSKFNDTAGFVLNGLKSKRQKSWKGIPEAWPALSVYWNEEKNMKKNGVALFRPIVNRSQYNSIPATMWFLYSYDNKSSLYDVKFDVTDENGKVLLSSGRKRMGSSGGYEFKNVSQDLMKIFDSGKARIVPTGVWLEYGQLTQSYYNDSRDWIKPLPEIEQDLQKMQFYLPGGINSQDGWVLPETEFYIHDTGVVNVGKFYIMTTEVTCGQYSAIMGSSSKNKGSRYPVSSVNWTDAVIYCNRLSIRQGLTPCYSINDSTDTWDWDDDFNPDEVVCDFQANGWRLPTVSEWQYAARGGDKNEKFKYSGSNNIDEVGWWYENSNYQAHEVATKKPNALGLYDMTGNLGEWCWNSLKRTDGTEYFINSNRRAVMGGNWDSYPNKCETSYVNAEGARNGGNLNGFRMVRNAEELPDSVIEEVKPEPDTKAPAEVKIEAEPATKTKEAKEKKAKKTKKEAESQQEAEPSTDAVAEAEDGSEEEDDDDEEKSNIFTKVKDKAKEAKDKVVETKDKVKDKVTSKKKKKK